MSEQTKTYKIKPGQRHHMKEGRRLRTLTGGDTLELTRRKADAIRDKIVEAGTDEAQASGGSSTEQANLARYKMEHRGGGRWDVIDSQSGEAINTSPLTREQAEALRKTGKQSNDESDD